MNELHHLMREFRRTTGIEWACGAVIAFAVLLICAGFGNG